MRQISDEELLEKYECYLTFTEDHYAACRSVAKIAGVSAWAVENRIERIKTSDPYYGPYMA